MAGDDEFAAPDGSTGVTDDPLDPVGWDDPLTGAQGPRYWSRLLEIELARSRRYKRPITIVLVELAGAEALAKTWGSAVASQAVAALGGCVRRNARTSDHMARIGAFRFGLLLTETGEVAAINLIERVRESCPSALPPAAAERIRVAFGWASPTEQDGAEDVLARAAKILASELRA